jgi:4-amino-4-deoxychorismate lyase
VTESVVVVLGRGLVDPSEPVLLADDLGLSRGDGCFETARVITEPDGTSAVQNLDAHLARLARSVRAMEIEVDLDDCQAVIDQAVSAWKTPVEAAVKLMVTRGLSPAGPATVIATVHEVNPKSILARATGIRVVTLPRGTSATAYADADWLLGGVMSLSYAFNMAALREAERRGADDALWFSLEGDVLEAPTATVVWTEFGMDGRRDSLRTTPSGANGILAGTTMASLFDAAATDGFETGAGDLRVDALANTHAIWLVSSIRGVVEVVEIDGSPRATHPALTERLQKLAGF